MKSEDARFLDDFDKIMRWYQDEVKYPISDSLNARRLRWISAREWVLTARPLTDSFVVKFLMGAHEGLSEPQAWRDVRDSKRFFASLEKSNKEYDRIMLIAQVRDLRAKAEFNGELAVAAKCDTTLQKMGVGDEPEKEESTTSKDINLHICFDPRLVGAKEIKNVFQIAAKFIGEEAARRELMIQDENEL